MINMVDFDELKRIFFDAIKGTVYVKDWLKEPIEDGRKGYAVFLSFLFEIKNEHGANDGVMIYRPKQNQIQIGGEKQIKAILEKLAEKVKRQYPNMSITFSII